MRIGSADGQPFCYDRLGDLLRPTAKTFGNAPSGRRALESENRFGTLAEQSEEVTPCELYNILPAKAKTIPCTGNYASKRDPRHSGDHPEGA